MPSVAEGLPIVGVQALAMGLAIVGGWVGRFIELVEQGRMVTCILRKTVMQCSLNFGY